MDIAKNVGKTIENRCRIEKDLLKKFNIGVSGLADYFEVPLTSITKDLKAMGVDADTYKRNHSGYRTVERLKKARASEIKSRLAENEEPNVILEDMGLWRMPADVDKVPKNLNIPGEFGESRKKLMRKAFSMCEKGVTSSAVFEYLGLSRVEQEYFKAQGIPDAKKDDFVKESSVSYVRDGNSPEDVSRLTGFSKCVLDYAEKGFDPEVKLKYYGNKKDASEKDAKMEDAYRRHLNGEREVTIAESMGVTRVTIMNWIRKKKVEHMDERVATGEGMFYRRRNTAGTEKHGNHSDDVSPVSVADAYRAEADAKRAFGVGVMAHFGYGTQAGTTKTMSLTEHQRLVERQHLNKKVYKKSPEKVKDAVMFGGYKEILKEEKLLKEEEPQI